MRHALIPHAEFRPEAGLRIDADVTRLRGGAFALRYIVRGAIGGLRLPPVATPARTDELWRSTCFEAFLRADAGYYEFNLSPSTQWAAYRFDGYRSGMRDVDEIDAPYIEVRATNALLEVRVSLDLDRLPDLPRDMPWCLGLSAVIEETSGRKSYWALAHPSAKPDFHHSDCFALEVPTALGP